MPYFTTTSVTVSPQTCYYVTGCNELQNYYSSDKFVDVTNPDAFIEDKSTIKMTDGTELTCQRHSCNLADEWGTSRPSTYISADANYIKSCEYDESTGKTLCTYYLNRCYKAMNCSAIDKSTLKCGDVSCNSSQHFVFEKGRLPGSFVGQPTSEGDCYEYLTKASANATRCKDSSELTCTLNSNHIGPSGDLLYTCTTSFAPDIYGKNLEYSSCSVDFVDLKPDNPEEGVDGNVEMIRNTYHIMCGKDC